MTRELYSYVLFLEARRKGLKVKYHYDYTDGAEKYAVYTNKQDKKLHVVYKKKADIDTYAFIIKELDETEIIYYESMDNVLDYIEKTIKPETTNK